MKRLHRLILVNWYLLDSLELEIEGHTAVIGPNASGKSSLLDAIQAALFGGHGHYLSLNPSAGEKSRRTLREYCLGIVRDPADPEQFSEDLRPRERALSRVVLVFRDEDTGREDAAGIAMAASLDSPGCDIEGRFVAAGQALTLADLTTTTAGGETLALPWAQLRERLRRRDAEGGFRALTRPEEYVREVCALLGHGGQHIDHTRFLKNFRNALVFAPLRDVTEFVRRYILDDRPIEVERLRRSLASYRDIHDKIQQVSARIEMLRAIARHQQAAARQQALADQYAWALEEARFRDLEERMAPLESRLEEGREQLARLERHIARLEEERETLGEKIAALKEQRAALDVSGRMDAIEAGRREARAELDGVGRRLDELRRRLATAWQLGDAGLAPPAQTAVETVTALLPTEDALAALWPQDAQAMDDALGALAPELERTRRGLAERRDAAVVALAALTEALQSLRARIRQLESGATPLAPATVALQQLLADHGIAATPVCDLVDVADEHWRDAVEAVLGMLREALVVDPEQAEAAVRLYRRQGRELHGARIVNTRQTEHWLQRAEARSLAALIRTDDPHARAYLNRQLGRVIAVESEAELLAHQRAATADGMLHTAGAVTRMRPVEPLLGRAGRERQLEHLKARFAEDAARHSRDETARERLEAVLEGAVKPLLGVLAEAPPLAGLCAARAQARARLEELDAQAARLDTRAFDRINSEITGLEERRKGLAGELAAGHEQARDLNQDTGRLQQELAGLEAQSRACAEARARTAAAPGLELGEALQRLGELGEQYPDGYGPMLPILTRRRDEHFERRDRERDRALRELTEYAARHGGDPPEDHAGREAWVQNSLASLEATELDRYATQARHALESAELAFRADFVGRLQDYLRQVDDAIREINQHLKKRPFHGEYYRFRARPEAGYEPILSWLKSLDQASREDVGGLFDFEARADSPHARAIALIRDLLSQGAEAGPDTGWRRLADYRNYYTFDVLMTDAEGRNETRLSERLGKGSGGEHQSPFYVAIGAALAATYRLRREPDGSVRGGLALAVFDEAFSKLDVRNAISALEFLKDLGMQVVLAAPDEKWGLLAEHMDTMVNVYRTGGAVAVEPQYLSAAARALLAADNPLHAPAPAAQDTVPGRGSGP